MTKKNFFIIMCCALLVLAVSIPLGIMISNKVKEKNLYSSFYTLDENFIIEAQNGSFSQNENSIEFIKTAYGNGANCVELDLTFDPSGIPYVAENPYEIKSGTLTLEQVFTLLSKDSSYKNSYVDLKIHSTDNLSGVEKLCIKYDVDERVFLTGINVNQASIVKSQTSLPFYLSINLENSSDDDYLTKVFNDISNSSAIGIVCNVEDLSDELCELLKENWIKISFENVNSKKECIKSLKLSPYRIKTDKPYLVQEIAQKWQVEAPVEFYGVETTKP